MHAYTISEAALTGIKSSRDKTRHQHACCCSSGVHQQMNVHIAQVVEIEELRKVVTDKLGCAPNFKYHYSAGQPP